MAKFLPVPGAVFGGGNLAAQNAFDVIFPLQASPFNNAAYALSSHPVLEAWGDSVLSGYGTVQGDTKVFWATLNENAVLSSAIRAIPTSTGASAAGWAASANVTRGTTYPTLATQNRVLDTNLSTLPLFAAATGLIGSGTPPASGNRAMFNLAFALHVNSSTAAGDLNCYLGIRYTFTNNDPTCTIRANSSASDTLVGSPNILTMPGGYMMSIAGDDSDLLGPTNQRRIAHADTGADVNNPFFTKPTAAFPVLNFSGKIVVQQA